MKKTIYVILLLAAGAALRWGVDAYRLPQSRIENRESKIATPASVFTPDPELLNWADAMLAQKPWLEARSSDEKQPPGASPATTFIVSRAEPVVTREGNEWRITFGAKAETPKN